MIEGTSTRVKHLDGWRGLAILTVLVGHFSPLDPELGNFGVELFFVLSGRLMAQILFEKKMVLPVFFQRRFARVYPALVVLVLGLTMLSFIAAMLGKDRGIDLLSAICALTFTFNYLPALGYPTSGTLEHIWSLAVEEHCYALLALLAVITSRQSRWVMPICFGLAALAMLNGLRLYFEGAGRIHEIYWRTDVRLAPVFLSAAIYLSKPTKGSLVAALLSVPLFVILPLWLKFIVPTILLAYSVNAIDHAPWKVLRTLSHPLIVGLGMISYSLYLWQQLFYKLTAGSAFGVVPSLVVAWISYKYVEVPARRAINSIQFGKLRYSRP